MDKASLQDITDFKHKVIDAALDLAASKNWADVSMYAIAQKAEVELDGLTALFDDKDAILAAYAAMIDKRVAEAFTDISAEDNERDRLFDVLMERFDILNENRAAILSIINAMTLDPKQIVTSLPYLCKSMRAMADTANIKSCGIKGAIKIAAITGIYIKTLKHWIKDDSPDMAATMASLDKGLGYFEKIN